MIHDYRMIHDYGPPRKPTIQEAVQILYMHPTYMPLISDGYKAITIRKGRKDIKLGPTLIVSTEFDTKECEESVTKQEIILVEIQSVRHTLLQDVTVQEYRDDNCKSLEDLQEALGEHYGNINSFDPVTVIRWALGYKK